ncbi:hypothetical protein [Providencia phage PSTCR6]|nr:hypothetical protein [Providencia phage PSTCR6]
MIKSLALHEIIAESGDFKEGPRIKHDRCCCESRFTFNEENLGWFSSFDTEQINKELEPYNETFESLKGRTFVIYGTNTYYDGAEWDPEIYEVIEADNPLVDKLNTILSDYMMDQNIGELIYSLKEFKSDLEKELPKLSKDV